MQCHSVPTNPLAYLFLARLQKAEQLFLPLSRQCGAISDSDFLLSGIHRVLDSTDSGRDHLQKMAASLPIPVKRSSYFESLKSERRLAHTQEVSRNICNAMPEVIPDLLAKALPVIDDYEVFAGDGHWHSHATHDKATVFRKYHASLPTLFLDRQKWIPRTASLLPAKGQEWEQPEKR